jgi:exopolysaccharide biosynthesis polyprenyl glycosylphosphotransferase
MTSRQKKTILLLGDVIALVGALALTMLIRYGTSFFNLQFTIHLPRFAFIFLVFIVSLYINQLYDLNLKVRSSTFLRRTINTLVSAGLVSIIYFYLSISSDISPKTNLAIFIVFFLFFFSVWRFTFQAFSSLKAKNGLAIIGDNEKTKVVISEIQKNPGAGYSLEMVIKTRDQFSELARRITASEIKTVVLCDDFDPKTTGPFLLSLLPYQISVANYPDFYEDITHKIPVEALGTEWFLENLKEGNRAYFQFIKRVIDVSLSGFILIITLPLWAVIATAIRLESDGPVFFKQVRLGRQGKKFVIYKFRTMKTENNDESMTKEKDDRITTIGHFLRKTRLDELPQTINILKGEMSFIGPRPERPELASELEESVPFYNVRLIVKPGLSGLDQVSGEYHSPSRSDTLKKLQHDLFYIKNRSVYLDSVIALKTIATVFKGYGR